MQNFLRQGVLPPYKPRQGANFQDPSKHLIHRLSFPQFKIEWHPCMWISVRKWGRAGGPRPNPIFDDSRGKWATQGNLKLVEAWNLWRKWCIQSENSLQNYVNFTLGNRFSWAFKTIKPISFRGLRPLDPRCHDGISDENSTNRQFSAKLYVNSAPWSYPLKWVFLCFKNANLKPMSFQELNPWTPSTRGVESWHWSPVKMVQIENWLQNNIHVNFNSDFTLINGFS